MSNMSYPISRYGPVPRQRQRIHIDFLWIALTAFILTDIGDIVTTVLAERTGFGHEADPPVAWMIHSSNLASLVLLPLVGIPFTLFIYRFFKVRGELGGRIVCAIILMFFLAGALSHGIASFHNVNVLHNINAFHVIAASR